MQQSDAMKRFKQGKSKGELPHDISITSVGQFWRFLRACAAASNKEGFVCYNNKSLTTCNLDSAASPTIRFPVLAKYFTIMIIMITSSSALPGVIGLEEAVR